MNLKNKKILITGATGGIGNSLVDKFTSLGSTVAATGTNEEKLNNLKKKYPNIYSLGDVMNAPNAKTAAAARMQAPVVATNVLYDIGIGTQRAIYDGYGSCPLTVEKGKIVLAEFGYGRKLLPTFPTWLVDSTKPSKLAWFLKEKLLPPIYWKAMLKGKEWFAKPKEFTK